MTVTACQPRIVRSPFSRMRTTPPRGEAWYPVISVLPSFAPQYDPRAVCAEPVTGSSSMPDAGAKKRLSQRCVIGLERA